MAGSKALLTLQNPSWRKLQMFLGVKSGRHPLIELNIRRDPTIYDGQFSNNGWLQELPKPMTKLTWDNAVLIGPKMAERMQHQNEDVVELELNGKKVTGPVWVQAGHPDNSVTIFLGYGRTPCRPSRHRAGLRCLFVAHHRGAVVRHGPQLSKTGDTYNLASTQGYQTMDAPNGDHRPLVRETTLEDYRKNPNFAANREKNRRQT